MSDRSKRSTPGRVRDHWVLRGGETGRFFVWERYQVVRPGAQPQNLPDKDRLDTGRPLRHPLGIPSPSEEVEAEETALEDSWIVDPVAFEACHCHVLEFQSIIYLVLLSALEDSWIADPVAFEVYHSHVLEFQSIYLVLL